MTVFQEDDEGLTEEFKAHLGLAGLDGINEVVEIEMAMDWETDETIASFKFQKFAKNHFQGGINHEFSMDPIQTPLLLKKHDVDRPVMHQLMIPIFLKTDKYANLKFCYIINHTNINAM